MAIGGGLLVFAFRSLGKIREGDKRHLILFAVAILFILLACAGLLIWSDLQAPQ